MIKRSVKQPPPRGIILFPSSDLSPSGYAGELSQFLLKSYLNPNALPDGTYQVDADGVYQHTPSASPIQGDVKIVSDNYVKTSLPLILGGNCYWEKTGTNIVLSWHGPFGFEMGESPIVVPTGQLPTKSGYSEFVTPLLPEPFDVISYFRFSSVIHCHGIVSTLPNLFNHVLGAAWIDGTIVCLVATLSTNNREIYYSKNAFSDNPDWISAGVINIPIVTGTINLKPTRVASFSSSGLKIVHFIDNVKRSNTDPALNIADHYLQNRILRVTLSQDVSGDITISSEDVSSVKEAFFETTGAAPSNTVDIAIGFKNDTEVVAQSVVDSYSRLESSSLIVATGPGSGEIKNTYATELNLQWQITTSIGLSESFVSVVTQVVSENWEHHTLSTLLLIGNSVYISDTTDSFDGYQILFLDFQSEKTFVTKSQKSFVAQRNWTNTSWSASQLVMLGGTIVDDGGIANENRQYLLNSDLIWDTDVSLASGHGVGDGASYDTLNPTVQSTFNSKTSGFTLEAILIPHLQFDSESIRVVVEDGISIGQYDFDEAVRGSIMKTFLPSGQTISSLFTVSGNNQKLVSDLGSAGSFLFRI